jgi:hypothetical protein
MAKTKASSKLKALPKSPSLAQTLPSDAVLDALKMILLGAPLNEVLTTITRLIEAHSSARFPCLTKTACTCATASPKACRKRTAQRRTESALVLVSDHAAQLLIFVSLSSSLTSLLTRDG